MLAASDGDHSKVWMEVPLLPCLQRLWGENARSWRLISVAQSLYRLRLVLPAAQQGILVSDLS
jgi:hypothetical protein